MSDFNNGFWNIWVAGISVLSVLACFVLLIVQNSAKTNQGETTGHVWDEDLREYNNPLPNWWRWMFYITLYFSVIYLAMYPGLGTFSGQFNWSSAGQYEQEMKKAEEQYGPIYKKFASMDIPTLSTNSEAREMGQRLFLTYCAQCHGSDAKGSKGFANLTAKGFLYGAEPDQIKETIAKGRDVMMPAKGTKPDLNGDQIKDLAHHVRALSGLASDSIRAQRGKDLFGEACAACHGPDGQGMPGVAPNLADKVWLYGSSEDTIVETITKGRTNRMPAFGDFLGNDKVHLLTAYVYGLGAGAK